MDEDPWKLALEQRLNDLQRDVFNISARNVTLTAEVEHLKRSLAHCARVIDVLRPIAVGILQARHMPEAAAGLAGVPAFSRLAWQESLPVIDPANASVRVVP